MDSVGLTGWLLLSMLTVIAVLSLMWFDRPHREHSNIESVTPEYPRESRFIHGCGAAAHFRDDHVCRCGHDDCDGHYHVCVCGADWFAGRIPDTASRKIRQR